MLITTQEIDSFNPNILFILHSVINKGDVPMTHYHAHDFVEFSIITSGEIDYCIEGSHYLLEKDDVMIFNPGVRHQGLVNPSTVCTELHIGITDLNIDCISNNFIRPFDGAPILSVKKYKDEFLQCCNEIAKEQRLRQLGHSFILKSLVMKLIIILYREMDECSAPPFPQANQLIHNDKKVIIQSLVDYLSSYYMEDISLDYLSTSLSISPAYLSKIFKEETGSSPIQYLIQIRLEKAKSLLGSSSLPIKNVAKAVGYDDAYYFSNLFKKHYNLSPSAYREDLCV